MTIDVNQALRCLAMPSCHASCTIRVPEETANAAAARRMAMAILSYQPSILAMSTDFLYISLSLYLIDHLICISFFLSFFLSFHHDDWCTLTMSTLTMPSSPCCSCRSNTVVALGLRVVDALLLVAHFFGCGLLTFSLFNRWHNKPISNDEAQQRGTRSEMHDQ